ncbi:MAG TPA: C40 family peptidase [Micromonosporaceae bacterium]|nr:C40 family peptidase [Micromonosporaceae bacterium]
MARSNRSRHDRQTGTISPVLRPLAWSALLTATVAAAFATPAFATPAYAEPPLPDAIPDAGARPVPAGTFQLPGVGPVTVQAPAQPLVNGPLAAAAYAKEVEVAALGDQLLQLRQEQKAATDNLAAAEARLQAARDAVSRAQEEAEAVATNALKDAAALPPGIYGTDLQGLSELSRISQGQESGVDRTTTERELARARAAEETASEEIRALQASAAEVGTRFTQLEAKHRLAEASLLKLRRDNTAQLQVIERAQEAFDQRLGANFVGRSRSGMTAHPSARAAVQYALAQLGDPYVWAAEGPDSFDCSGLMWAAYRSAGYYQLPRVSRDQFKATSSRRVSLYDLLPGDLIFFAPPGSSWTGIHHVGMYIGDGFMVHAPRTGDVVKIAPVWWTRIYGATRIFGEVPSPGLPPIISVPPVVVPPTSGGSTPPSVGTPTTPPTGTPTPSPTAPRPSGTPTPTPRPTTPTPTPTPTSPTPTPTSPTPTPDPTGTPTPEPTGSSGSPDAAPEPTPSESPSGESSSPAAATEPTTAASTSVSASASTGGS